MSLQIRKWTEEDIETLVRLNFQWGYETTAKNVSANLKRIDGLPNSDVLVADIDEKVVGFIYIREHITIGGVPFGEVHGLVVDENFRKRGIGSALIKKAISWCNEKGLSNLKLRTNKKRVEANIFYPKIGFAISKEQYVYEMNLG